MPVYAELISFFRFDLSFEVRKIFKLYWTTKPTLEAVSMSSSKKNFNKNWLLGALHDGIGKTGICDHRSPFASQAPYTL